jgi:hypothetical protein
MANSQVVVRPTPAPLVTALNASWYQRAEPIFYAGDYYFRAGPRVFFNGDVMVPIGNYDGVPLYTDTTVEPYSLVLVPVGGGLMQPFERRRARGFAGTTGSHTPEFPVQSEGEAMVGERVLMLGPPAVSVFRPVDTSEADRARYAETLRLPGRIETIRQPQDNQGVWFDYDSRRWRSAGRALAYSDSRFVQVGRSHEFPVYRERDTADTDRIFIPTSEGFVAPFRQVTAR